MATVTKLKPNQTLQIDTDNAAADLVSIKDCALHVRRRIKETNAAEAWIEVGRSLSDLKRGLKKASRRGDNERIGWVKAFQLGHLPFSRSTADMLIKVAEYFLSVTTSNTLNFPASWKALYLIATKFDQQIFEAQIANGSICSATTEAEIRNLAKSLGLIKKPKPRDPIDTAHTQYLRSLRKTPATTQAAEIRNLIFDLGLTLEDIANG